MPPELLCHLHQVGKGTGQAIQLEGKHDINAAPAYPLHDLIKARALGLGSADRVLYDFALGPAPALTVFPKLPELAGG